MQDLQTPQLQPALSTTSKLITHSSWFNPNTITRDKYFFKCLMFDIQNCNYRDIPIQLCVSNSEHFIKASCTERTGLAAPQRACLSNICYLPLSANHSCRTGYTFVLKFHCLHQDIKELPIQENIRADLDLRTGLSL